MANRTVEQILAEHAAWWFVKGGRRLVWGGLSESERANLRDAVLRGADLRGAVLTGAYLRSADLTGARGIDVLHTSDRGYVLVAVEQSDGEWLLYGGCRGPWTAQQGRDHWGSADYPDPERGAAAVAAIDAWEARRGQ